MQVVKYNIRLWIVVLLSVITQNLFAQSDKPLTLLWNNGGKSLKGDFVMIGNNAFSITGRDRIGGPYTPNDNYDAETSNGTFDMAFIDIDDDPSTFQSSAATLAISSNQPACLTVKQAYLYWVAHDQRLRTGGAGNYTDVKFKMPGQTAYQTLTADVTHWNNARDQYYCRKDVTALLQGNATLNGEYMVADISGTPRNYVNSAGGWSLVVVYEDKDYVTLNKNITFFEGLEGVRTAAGRDLNVNGIRTVPFGPVRAKVGLIVSEGDRSIVGDRFFINGVNQSVDVNSPNKSDNFFDSSISHRGQYVTNRRPASKNAVGWDVDYFDMENTNNATLGNNATSATLTFSSGGDVYMPIFAGFSVEVIAPNIELEKDLRTFDAAGNEINGKNQPMSFGQSLVYTLNFRNVGNDDALDAVLEDILPANVDYQNISQPLPEGVTFVREEKVTVNGVERSKVIFNIADSRLKKGATGRNPYAPIKINVKVVPDCRAVRDACANEIGNQAEIFYYASEERKAGITDRHSTGSFNGVGNCGTEPNPTFYFLQDPSCDDPQEITLCGLETTLTAGAGFTSYEWKEQGGTRVLGTERTLKVTKPGTYVVTKTMAGGNRCGNDLTETYTVKYFNNQNVNPLRRFATQLDVCGNDGKEYVQIYLCGTDTKTLALTGYTTNNIKWYRFSGTRPTGLTQTCPVAKTTANSAQWELLHTGASYTLSQAASTGTEYAVEITTTDATGANCLQAYYFRAYKNDFKFKVETENILCSSQGKLKVSGIPAGNYQYKVMKGSTPVSDWVDVEGGNRPFEKSVATAGLYTVYIRPKVNSRFQNNVCEYPQQGNVINVDVRNEIDITPTEITCQGVSATTGKLRVQIGTNVRKPFTVQIKRGTTNVVSYTSITDTDTDADIKRTLDNLVEGTYDVIVTTPNNNGNCNVTKQGTITSIPRLRITSLTAPQITCDGKKVVNVTVTGGVLINNGYGFKIHNQNDVELVAEKIQVNETGRGTISGELRISYKIEINDTWPEIWTSRTYKVIAVDANNCNEKQPIELQEFTRLTFKTEVQPADCDLTAGSIKLLLDGINPAKLATDYKVKYSIRKKIGAGDTERDYEAWRTYQTSNVFTGLEVGTYQTRISYEVEGNVCFYPEDIKDIVNEDLTVTRPNPLPEYMKPIPVEITDGGGPVRAFVGVVRLACNMGTQRGATVRVSNISGGQHIGNGVKYQIKFADRAWANDVTTYTDIAPGTYTVRVRGKNNNCEYTQTVVVEPPLPVPTVTPTLAYDCEGKGVVTLKPNNGNYSYSYDQTTPTTWQDNTNAFTLTNTYPVGTHKVKVFYKNKTSLNPNVLINENFGAGRNTSNPYVYPDYRYQASGIIDDGAYSVTSRENNNNITGNANWTTPNDHTGLPQGRYLAMNVGSIGYNKPIYYKVVDDVLPNQPIKYKMYVYNLCHSTACAPPEFKVRISDENGNVLNDTGRTVAPALNGRNPNAWEAFEGEIPALGRTKVRVEIISMSRATGGNDLAIDDIYVYQEPEACTDYAEVDITVAADKQFDFSGTGQKKDVTCNGGADGTYTVNVKNFNTTNGFKYSLTKDGVAYRPTVAGQYLTHTNQQLQLTGLPKGNYSLQIRFDDTNVNCVKTLPFTITEPVPLQVTPANANSLQDFLNCGQTSKKVNIKNAVSVTGGTPPYRYFISGGTLGTAVEADANGEVTLPAAGTYTITVTYGANNGCNTATSRVTQTFVLDTHIAPTMELLLDCPTASGSKITANVTANAKNPNSTYRYYIKEGRKTAAGTYIENANNIFRNKTAGWYTIKATDQYSCSVEEEVLVHSIFDGSTAVVSKQDCEGTQTPGKITVTLTGGSGTTTNYQYAFVAVGATPSDADYQTSNEKVYAYATTDTTVDVWVRDTDKKNCHIKLRASVVVKADPRLDARVSGIDPYCEGEKGSIKVTIATGAAPFTIEVTDPAMPAGTAPVRKIENSQEREFIIGGLDSQAYKVIVKDKNGCPISADITLTNPVLNGKAIDWKRATADACSPATADLGFEITDLGANTVANNGQNYVYLYSKDKGLTWQTSPIFEGLAPGTLVQPVIGRFAHTTTVLAGGRASTPVLCTKVLDPYTTKVSGGVTIDYANITPSTSTYPGAGCTVGYNLPVKVEGTATYFDVAYALDSRAGIWNAGATTNPHGYTFTNLIPGREYTIHVRYKTTAGQPDYCYGSATIDLTKTEVPRPSITITPKVILPCHGTTNGEIDFTFAGGSLTTTHITYNLRAVDIVTGVETIVASNPVVAGVAGIGYNAGNGFPAGTAGVLADNRTLKIQNVPADINKIYYLEVEELPSACKSASVSLKMTPSTATAPVTATATATQIACEGNGTITVTATGGTGFGYTYKVKKALTGGNSNLRNDIISRNNVFDITREDFTGAFLATNPTSVTLDIEVTDSDGCTTAAPTQVTIQFDPKPTFSVAVSNNCTLPFTIKITPLTPSAVVTDYQYSIDGGITYQDSNELQVNANFNQQDIRMKHKATRCTSQELTPQVIVFPTFTANAQIISQAVCTPAANANKGQIQVKVNSGSGTYEYTIVSIDGTFTTGATTLTATAPSTAATASVWVPQGKTYKVTIVDKKIEAQGGTQTCHTIEVLDLVIDETHTPIPVPASKSLSCQGAADGEVSITLPKNTHTQGDYTFQLFDAGGTPITTNISDIDTDTQIGKTYTGLAAATYSFRVVSARGCEANGTVTVDEPAQLVGGVEILTTGEGSYRCDNPNGATEAKVVLTAQGGTAPYYFSIDGGATWERVEATAGVPITKKEFIILDTGLDQTINWKVSDSGNCGNIGTPNTQGTHDLPTRGKITSIDVTQLVKKDCVNPEQIRITINRNKLSQRGYEITAQALPTGATFTAVPVAIPLGSTATATTHDITLPNIVGTYTFAVKDLDTGCTEVADPYVVLQPELPTIVATTSKNACLGSDQVNIDLEIGGNVGTGFTYEAYRNGVRIPALDGNGTTTGRVSVVGTLPAGQTAEGTYKFVLKVASTNCEASTDIMIEEADNPITISIKKTQDISFDCNNNPNNDGSIALTSAVTGGWGPTYQYRLMFNGNYITEWADTNSFEGLEIGAYQIAVKDSQDCEQLSNTINFTAPDPISTNGAVPTTTPVTCIGGIDGTITVGNVTGGRADYSYTLYDKHTRVALLTKKGTVVTTSTPPVGTVTFTNLPAGDYEIEVTDPSFNCTTLKLDATVGTPTNITAFASITTFPDCNTDGSIQVSATGGTPAYTEYQRVDVVTNAPMGAPNTTGVFSIDHTVAATYKFVVTDANGCKGYTNEISVAKVEPITAREIPALSIKHISCNGDFAGKIVVEAEGGSIEGTFVYELLDATGATATLAGTPVPTNMTGVFENLPAGTYSVKVTKGANCAPAQVDNIVITEETTFTATGTQTDVTCNGNNDGKFQITITGTTLLDGTPRTFLYAISPRLDKFYDNGGLFTDLAPGAYTVIVQDQNGCRPANASSFDFVITEPPVFSVVVTPGSVIHEGCLGAADGQMKLTITGGIPFVDALSQKYYEVSYDNVTFNRYDPAVGLTGLSAGITTIFVRDNSACSAIEMGLNEIEPGVDLQPTHTGKYVCGTGTNRLNYQVTVSVNESEQGSVVYYVDGSTTPTNDPVFTFPVGTTPETHTIRIVREKVFHKVCNATLTIVVNPQGTITWKNPDIKNVSCNGLSDGKVDVNVIGGSGNYLYAISPNITKFNTGNQFGFLAAGFYTIVVKDVDFGCEITEKIQIGEPEAIAVDLNTSGLSCYGAVDGSVAYQIAGGTEPYNVTISGTGTFTGYTKLGVIAGTLENVVNMPSGIYTMEITDKSGCKTEQEFVIENAPNLEPKSIDVYYNCGNELGGTLSAPTYDVYVTLPITYVKDANGRDDLTKPMLINIDNLLYTLDGEPDANARRFTRLNGINIGVIENANLSDGLHSIKLFYRSCSNVAAMQFEVTNYTPMVISDVTGASQFNQVDISVTGGKAPYKLYFGAPIYTDPADLKAHYNEVTTNNPTSYLIQRSAYDSPANPGHKIVRVYVEDALGCGYYIDVEKQFYDIEIPRYFTPNNDGDKDTWTPTNLHSYPNAEVQIYDRYGRLIAKFDNRGSWDGKYETTELPTGDYWYIIKLNEPDDDRTFKGHFTLYR